MNGVGVYSIEILIRLRCETNFKIWKMIFQCHCWSRDLCLIFDSRQISKCASESDFKIEYQILYIFSFIFDGEKSTQIISLHPLQTLTIQSHIFKKC